MSTYSFVLCSMLLLISSVTNELQQCLAQQFLFGPPEITTRTTTTRSKDKAVTISPTTTMPNPSQPTVSTNDTIGMETESNVTLESNDLSCSQVVNITSKKMALHFRIPSMNSTVHCVITIHGKRNQHLFLQVRNISLLSGMLDCEQGSLQLYTLKQGLLYFRNRSCNSTQPLPQLTTENNVAILTVTSGKSKKEQHFELEVQTIANTESYGYPHAQYGPSGTSFGLPSIAFAADYNFEPPNFTYGTLGENYGQLSATYGPPGPTYGPPSATYGTPGPTYGPSSATRPLGPTYVPPHPTYGPPTATYGPPFPTYGPPRATYGPPSTTKAPPNATYNPPGGPSYLSSTYDLGNYSDFARENQHFGGSIDRHYNPVSDYGYEFSSPPKHEHNGPNYNGHTIQPSPPYDGSEHRCKNDCDKHPWKVTNSISYQGSAYYDPYSSPLYTWLTSGSKPKHWSNELY